MQSNANEFIFKHIYQIFVQNTMLVFIYLENWVDLFEQLVPSSFLIMNIPCL